MAPSLTNGTSHPGLAFYNIIDGKKRASSVNEDSDGPRTEEELSDAPVASARDLTGCLRINKLLGHIQRKEARKLAYMSESDIEAATHTEYYSMDRPALISFQSSVTS
ncbi:hypothetical protein F4861DRAFT_482358 [Xylaria intraflava]|nr:hypothetical protein F4861DRAFT_482358 [Xylaria intraflava]